MCLCTLLQAVRLLFQTALMLMFGFDSVLVPAGLLAIETAAQVADVPSHSQKLGREEAEELQGNA